MIRIIGDIILDVWIRGKLERNSPEANVKILDKQVENFNLGGASNVAANLKDLNCSLKLYGAIGKDNSGKKLVKLLNEKKISRFLDDNLETTSTKTRFIQNDSNHVLRVDSEKFQETFKSEKKLIKDCKKNDLVLVIDYSKGIVKKKTIKNLIKKNLNVFVDPKNDPVYYKGAFLVKPNMKRLKMWIGMKFDKNKCFELLKEMNWKWLVVTDGEKGVHIFNNLNQYKRFFSKTDSLKDVSGAGDTFMASLIYYHFKGIDIFKSSELACIAATKVVEKKEVQTITEEEILFNTVFTNGVFDILHEGHYQLIKFCKTIGKKLVVAINTDESVKKIKGPKRPHNQLKIRIKNLKKNKHIDRVVTFNNITPINLIKKIKPSVIIKGGDYSKVKVVGNKFTKVIIFPLVGNYSTTNILKKINKK
jgi:D-beta-D-heptose 7-phosphate kinase / D-beta-D-heptose 1-phosphate adenosyltransferase|tara:strand:+ start:2033 stop:3289 length:1257 start_codon:yes stop_codon:yes gene_type:complete